MVQKNQKKHGLPKNVQQIQEQEFCHKLNQTILLSKRNDMFCISINWKGIQVAFDLCLRQGNEL